MENNNQEMYGQQNKNGQSNQNMYGQNNQNMYGQNMGNPGMNNQNMYGQNMGNPGMNNQVYAPAPKNPAFVTWLTLSILQLLCCNQITGIISLIFTILADSDFKRGMMTEYNSKMKGAKIATIIGIIIGVLLYAFVFIYYVLILGLAFSGEF